MKISKVLYILMVSIPALLILSLVFSIIGKTMELKELPKKTMFTTDEAAEAAG